MAEKQIQFKSDSITKSESSQEENAVKENTIQQSSVLIQTCDYHPLSFMAMDYYKKYGQNRDFPQYFVLPSTKDNVNAIDLNNVQESSNDALILKPLSSSQLQYQDENKSARPPLIGQDKSNSEIVNDDILENIRALSPASSIASNKRLEWDSGADVGYSNYSNNKSRERTNSLPQLSTIERLALGKQMLRLEPEGVTNENQPNVLIVNSVSQSKEKNKIKDIPSSKCDVTASITYLKSNCDPPNAESTPLLSNTRINITTGCEITPILKNQCNKSEFSEKDLVGILKNNVEASTNTEYISSESEISNNKNSFENKKHSEKKNDCENLFNASKVSSNSCEDINLSPTVTVNKMRKYHSYSDLEFEIITSKTTKHLRTAILPTGQSKIEKQVQISTNNPFMLSKSIQVSNNDEEIQTYTTGNYIDQKYKENVYKVPSSSDDPLEGTSQMHKYVQGEQHATGTLNLPKSNSFEYLPGDTYEQITNSELQSESDSKSIKSKNKKSYKKLSLAEGSDTSALHSDGSQFRCGSMIEHTDELYMTKSNDISNRHPYSSNISSSVPISSPANSVNSTFERMGKSQFSNSLIIDLEKTIDLLKRLVESKKCSIKDKKKLIKTVVKKIVEATYEDDSSFDKSHCSKLKKKDDRKLLHEEKIQKMHRKKEKILDSETTDEDDILLHIYDRLGIEEDENGMLRKKNKHQQYLSTNKKCENSLDGSHHKNTKIITNDKTFPFKMANHDFKENVNKNDSQSNANIEKRKKYTCSDKNKNEFKKNEKDELKDNTNNYKTGNNFSKQGFNERKKQSRGYQKFEKESTNQCNIQKNNKPTGAILSNKKAVVSKQDNVINQVHKKHISSSSNIESISYDSSYNTSTSKSNWRENKTVSEQLYEEKMKSLRQVNKKYNYKNTENNQQKKSLNDGQRKINNDNNNVMIFIDNERKIQLSWISAEIKHLNNLRKLLERQGTYTCPQNKSVSPAKNEIISVNNKQIASSRNANDNKKHIAVKRSEKQIDSDRDTHDNGKLEISELFCELQGINSNNDNDTIDKSDFEWSSHKNMNVDDIQQNNNNSENLKKPNTHLQKIEKIQPNLTANSDLIIVSEGLKVNSCKSFINLDNQKKISPKNHITTYESIVVNNNSVTNKPSKGGIYTTAGANMNSNIQLNQIGHLLTPREIVADTEVTYLYQKYPHTDPNELKYCKPQLLNYNHMYSMSNVQSNIDSELFTKNVPVSSSIIQSTDQILHDSDMCLQNVEKDQITNQKIISSVPITKINENTMTNIEQYKNSCTQTSDKNIHSSTENELKLLSNIDGNRRVNISIQTLNYSDIETGKNEIIKKPSLRKNQSESTESSSDVFIYSYENYKTRTTDSEIEIIAKNYNSVSNSTATSSNASKCEFCTRKATKQKVIESIKNCKRCQSPKNAYSKMNKNFKLCSRCDKLIRNRLIQNQKCSNCDEENCNEEKLVEQKSQQQTVESQMSLNKEKCVTEENKKPIAYFLKVESVENLSTSDNSGNKNISLEEIKIAVPKRTTSKKNSSSSQDQYYDKISDFLSSKNNLLDKESKPSTDSQSNNHLENKKSSSTSLQEYLIRNRPDFVDIAEARRKCLQDIALLRRFKKEKRKMLWTLTSGFNDIQELIPSPKLKTMFSTKAMKEITKKRYKQLPEIQKHIYDQKIKQQSLKNRFMAQMFNKKLQKRVHEGQITLSHTVSVVSL